MKKLHLTVYVTSIGDTSIRVPDNLTVEEAIQYAKEHLSEVALPSNLDPDHGTMVLDEENCDFEDADETATGDEPWQSCRQLGYCTVLGEHSNPTVFDCDQFCPNRPR